ncbi:phospholipid scramblase [Plakobranchus ocellatus]|uniref:Phospholipid scramblase n=1 Tax=Plakobranchus ocellatus TaxID=259542 RepID=A0AAV4BGA0_9GAST|nr:phospholipid scramblase [Plakobranchus ocellatus]
MPGYTLPLLLTPQSSGLDLKSPSFVNGAAAGQIEVASFTSWTTANRDFCCTARLGIFDNDDTLLYEITGPCCSCQGPYNLADVNYPIKSAKDGQQVGNISKIWPRVLGRSLTLTGVQFPLDLDVKHKALMLGAVFLAGIPMAHLVGQLATIQEAGVRFPVRAKSDFCYSSASTRRGEKNFTNRRSKVPPSLR